MITYDVNLCIGMAEHDKGVVVKCHDTGVNLRVWLSVLYQKTWRAETEPYIIPEGSTAVLKIAKPDRTFVLADGVITGGYILFGELPPQTFTVAGTSGAEVSLFDASGRRLTTASFEIEVPKECVCDCKEESKPYVDIMAKQIQAAIDAEANAKKAAGVAIDAADRAEKAAEDVADLVGDFEGNIGAELNALKETVYGVHPEDTMLFDSKTDEFSTGAIGNYGVLLTTGTYANRFYIPGGTEINNIKMLDISSGSVKVRISSYSTKNAADRGYDVPASGHSVWIAQYDAEGNYVSNSRKNITSEFKAIDGKEKPFAFADLVWIEKNNNGYGCGVEAIITPADGAVYACISNFYKGVDIDIEVFIDGVEDSGAEPKDGIVDDIRHIREDMEGLVPQYRPEVENASLIATVFGKSSGGWYNTNFSALVVADMHGKENVDTKFISLDDAATIRDACVPNGVILNAGDMFYGRAKENGTTIPCVADYIDKAKKHCVYHTMGQHEVGFPYNGDDGRVKANCMTHEEVFQTFIEPMKTVWGLPNLTTNYYYKDFTAQKTRLISLYQYNVPLVDDETDSTKYKYDRNTVWLGQDQLDWLVGTLNTVPDGYKVIILQHQLDRDVVVDAEEHSAFHDGKTSIWYGGYVSSSKPVVDIVQAYINKTTIRNKTYAPMNTTKHPADLFTVTVNADFTNANGEFANYISGDVHFDFIGYGNGTRQRHIVLTACNTSYDCFVDPTAAGAHRSIVNLLGYDYKNGFVRLGRVGQQYSLAGQTRVFEKVTL